MDQFRVRYFLLLGLFITLAGCNKTPSTPAEIEPQALHEPSLISDADRRHDFGTVIGAQGRKRTHRYRLLNKTDGEVKILKVVNRKTCCGVVEVGPTILKPGEATYVGVTLVIGDNFGEVAHETEVLTDASSEPSLVFRTSANAVPAVRIEEMAGEDSGHLISGGPPRRVRLQVFASGTDVERPVDLDRMELRSTGDADWDGFKEAVASEDGLIVESRRITAVLDSAGAPGERRAEFLLQTGQQLHARHVVAWEVVAPLEISPSLIVVKPDQREHSFVVASRDQRPFRVVRVECQAPEIQARSMRSDAASSQQVRVEGVPGPERARGVVSVFTDYPDQGRIDVPYVLID